MNIHPVQLSDLPRIARFVAQINADSTHQIPYFGDTEDEIRNWLEGDEIAPEVGFYTNRDGEITGFMGIDYDRSQGRCWFHGPLVVESDWSTAATALYGAALRVLPPEIHHLELFGALQNTRLAAFAAEQGYQASPGTLGLIRGLDSPLTVPDGIASLAQEDPDVERLIELHDTLFPRTYYRGRQLVEKAALDGNVLLVARRGGTLQGYLFLQFRPADREAYIDYVGVAEEARGTGLGRGLLGACRARALAEPGIERLALSVGQDNASARRLFEGVGFLQNLAAVAYRRNRLQERID